MMQMHDSHTILHIYDTAFTSNNFSSTFMHIQCFTQHFIMQHTLYNTNLEVILRLKQCED